MKLAVSVCCTACLMLLVSACTPASTPRTRHVVLISLDTTRADHLGCYGNPWIRTPNLDRLAGDSIVFADYMTVVPTTLASHTSLFTGTYPHTHGTPRNGFSVNENNTMLPEILGRAGFDTWAFIGAFPLSARFAFDQGFDLYDEQFQPEGEPEPGFPHNQRRASAVTDAIIRQLDARGVPERLFLFAHYFDPHGPRRASPPYDRMYEEDDALLDWLARSQGSVEPEHVAEAIQYAGEVSYMDAHVGRLLDELKRRGILEESIVVVTSDHGENFWAHEPHWDHGWSVHQSTIAAVCIIRPPGGVPGGREVDTPVASIDVLPTLLGHLGLKEPGVIEGEAIDLPRPDSFAAERLRFAQATKPFEMETDPRWHNLRKNRCVRLGRLKLFQTPYRPREELFDLGADPFEIHDLLREPTPEVRALVGPLREQLRAWARSADPLPTVFGERQREDTIERLRALGYLE